MCIYIASYIVAQGKKVYVHIKFDCSKYLTIFVLLDLHIGSIDNVILPEELPVIISCPVSTSVDSVSWFMYDNDTSTISVFNGTNYFINTPGRYYCQATDHRGTYRSNTFTVYRVGKHQLAI